MNQSIDFFFAVPSPWTYLAGPRFKLLVQQHHLRVNWKPYEVPRVFALTGTKPVAERPPQIQKNRLADLKRWRDYLEMPLNLHPKFFPVNATPAAHMLISAKVNGADITDLANAYMRAVWAEEQDIADKKTLIDIADSLNFDGTDIFTRSTGAQVASEYEKNSEEAVSQNVFGTPTWIYKNELFWGQDQLDFLQRAIVSPT